MLLLLCFLKMRSISAGQPYRMQPVKLSEAVRGPTEE